MGQGEGVLLVGLLIICLCLQHRAAAAAADDGLPPILSPIINGACNAVECGRGSCRVRTDHAFGFVCECHPGWTKLHFGDHFQFLPCVIPNCTFDRTCYNATAPAPAPAPSIQSPAPSSDRSLFDPCSWSYCGYGTCVKTSEFGHRCDCSPGYGNLLNATVFPCFRECVLGADCARLGILLPTGSTPSSSSATNVSSNAPNRASTGCPRTLAWVFLLMVPLAMVPRT